MATLQVHADAVRHAITSTTTCTPATVVSLKSLLLPHDAESKPQQLSTTRAAVPSRPATSASSRPGTAASKRRAAGVRDDGQHNMEPCLSDKEKAQLATYVINAALKALAEAAKPPTSADETTAPHASSPLKMPSQSQPLPADGDDALSKSTNRGGLRRSVSAPMNPLHPRTLNRIATSPVKTVSKPTSVSTCSQSSQCLAMVECARVSFLTLRTLQDKKAVSLPELQLEAGMSSFVGKLLALNMLDHACRELRVLKKRLQGTLSPAPASDAPAGAAAPPKPVSRTKTSAMRAAKTAAPTHTAEPTSTSLAADLLDYGDVSSMAMPTIKLIVASQLQALRVLAALKKPSNIDSALPFLRRSCSSSPVHLASQCIKAASTSHPDQQKAMRQMDTLLQLLFALAPNVSSKEDASATEPTMSIAPLSALELQSLSLETRLRRWTMVPADSAYDADKDVMSPFARCLSAYTRRCRSAGRPPSYASCRSRFDNIYELIQRGKLNISETSKSPLAIVYQSLSSTAREAGHLDDAIHWASKLLDLTSNSDVSAAKRCSTLAYLLALQLKDTAKKHAKDNYALLAEVLESIKGSLKGDTSELEDLLANVCSVRKAAVNFLVAHKQSSPTSAHNPHEGDSHGNRSTASKIPQQGRDLLEAFVCQCPHFCLRWLGKPPAAKSSTKDFLRYEQRRQLLTQSIRHTLDSAFVVTKSMIEEGRMVWEQLDSVLSDSLTILEYLGDTKTGDAASSYFVKISHFYYLSYNVLRRKGGVYNDRDALKALRRAIDCVKHRSGPERDKAQLVLKLERLAELSKATGHIGEALTALQSIRSCLVDAGALADVTAAFCKGSPSLAWMTHDRAESLSRTLIKIHRLEEVHMDWTAGLDEMEQAAVLEHQLHFAHFSAHGSRQMLDSEKLDLSHSCIITLLRIYYPTRFPIRRLRTLLRLFSANIDAPDVLADIAPQIKAALGLIESQGLADDAHLDGYLTHYRALAASLTGFSEGYMDSDVLQECLSAWSSLLDANATSSALELVVDNIGELQTHLHSISEFMRAMGRDSVVTNVLELSQRLSSIVSASNSIHSFTLQPPYESALSLASHYLRMGEHVKTGKLLEEVRSYFDNSHILPGASTISFHLSYAEYLIEAGRFDEANRHILEAHPVDNGDPDQHPKTHRMSGAQKRKLGAYACFLLSFVALEKGDYSVALQNARNSTRVLFQDWTRLEKSMSKNLLLTDGLSSETEEVSSSTSTSGPSVELGASLHEPSVQEHSSTAVTPDTLIVSVSASSVTAASPEFWTLFHPLFNSMLRLSSIYAHLGMFQETMYYAEQAQKVALATHAALSLAQAEAWLATVHFKAGHINKAVTFIAQARSRLPNMDQTSRKAALVCDLANLYRDMNDGDNEQEMMRQAEAIVEHICSSGPESGLEVATPEIANDKSMEVTMTRATAGRRTRAASAAAKVPTRPATARKTASGMKAAKKTAVATSAQTTSVAALLRPCDESSTGHSVMHGLRAALLIQKAMSHLNKKDWAVALSILRGIGDASSRTKAGSRSRAEVLVEQIALASSLLGYGTEQMAQDAVFSVVQDSTLSFPAVSSGIVMAGSDGGDGVSVSKSPGATKLRVLVPAVGRAVQSASSFVEMLQEAQDRLIEAQAIAAIAGDSVTLNRISSMLQSAVIVLSATSWSKPRVLGPPIYASCSVELARNMTWKRERRAVLVEKSMMAKPELMGDVSWWPAVPSESTTNSPRRSSFTGSGASNMSDINIGRFQRDYNDIIPRDWSVISMTLSENQHDLCITKLQAGQSPFVIRLPLERAISRDADNEVFNFHQGRSELLDIVKAINDSCHDARDMTVKGAKSSWWTEREALDTRLKELLDNVEQIWLGGFRGIFSQHVRRPTLFSRFQKAFQNILDKHLPSRRSPARGKKRGGKSTPSASSARISLDSRVLDLFIGLGDATVEDCDFDDALDDLLYFVVDILQFHGEHNAYDEIDFDAMVVETFEALYAYHSAIHDHQSRSSVNAAVGPEDHRHTILVLDKALHVFPWESLPCMQNLAVSRVPSLTCLRRLILDQQLNTTGADKHRDSSAGNRPSGFHASLSRGAYMLNPSGDLPSTEATFDGPLSSSLRGSSWTRIVGRTPTEDEFETILCDKDVLLYFGHGSGAQYIRGRTVRKLEKCRAATLLMGCSSAGLNYNGEFELHGPVWDYMLAGCPAVVGTLWDVTDKDIDRYAGQTFEEWGLVPRGAFGEKGGKKTAARSRSASPPPSSDALSLVEAMARARSAPRFRYLTAAAVCVYGIPVYLS